MSLDEIRNPAGPPVNPSPPPYLLGAAVMLWAVVMERVVPGLICALLIEGAHWTRVRWAFGERASLVAWRLSVLFLTLAMVLVLVQGGPRINTMARVFTWLPVILMPLQFVQSYGIARSLSLSTFSVMVRRRRQHAEEHGLPFRDLRFRFGNVYFCATLLAACLGRNANEPWYYPCLVLLVAWALFASWRGVPGFVRGVGTATLLAALLAGAGGYAGQKGLTALYRYLTMGQFSQEPDSNLTYARERRTSIGALGQLKQSPEIVWRLIPERGPLPLHLRISSYNTYQGTIWSATIPTGHHTAAKDFEALPELGNPDNPEDPEDKFQVCPPDLEEQGRAIDPALPRFRVRGSVRERGDLFPLPSNAASLHRFAFEELERNSFGTFKIKPSQPVSDARVLWGDEFATEAPPWTSIGEQGKEKRMRMMPDLAVPDVEAVILKEVVEEIGLRNDESLEDKIQRLRAHFLRFQYTRYNSVPRNLDQWARGSAERKAWLAKGDRTLLGAFLQYSRAGHCEYFATATALLLREVGVPTRYVSGFAVVERDRKSGEAFLRGTHAHAWCRAWDERAGKWIDVDLTPPDWTGLETPRMSRFQDLQDWFQRLREDLLVWRDQPGNMAIITGVLLAPIFIGMAFVGRKLWKSRQRVADESRQRRGPVVHAETPLSALEKPARKLLGERPAGMPLGPWLLQLAPRLRQPEVLFEALQLHHKLRFDPGLTEPGLAARLGQLVAELRKQFRDPHHV